MKLARHTLWLAIVAIACSSSSSSTDSTDKPGTPVQADRSADPRERVLGPLIASILEGEHLRSKTLDDAVSEKAFAKYIELLDPGKLFLLDKHVKQLEVHAKRMDDQMKSGSLSLAHAGSILLRKRLAVVKKMITGHLQKPFDYNRKETLETDDEKLAFAKTEAELSDRWRKNLKLQVMARAHRMEKTRQALEDIKKGKKVDDQDAGVARRRSGPIPATAEGREKKARADVAKTYDGRFVRLSTPEPLDGAAMFINAVTQIYDPHTMYMAPVAKENFDIRMSGSLEGIGAVLIEDDHYIRIEQIVPGGASWRQGELEAGDLILAVAQLGKEPVDVVDMRINRVVRMIRGPKGTIVSLTVKKPDGQIKVISITRDVVKIETAYARGAVVTPKSGKKVGYIYLPSFYGNTRNRPGMTPERRAGEDVGKLLSIFAKRGDVAGVIIDLRGNGGGLLEDAREITGLLVETGPVVQTRLPDGEVEILKDRDPKIVFKGHVVVMVDRGSASASEILAGALQDYGRALVVGTSQTHGKGTVQILLSLDRIKRQTSGPSLGVLKLTRQQFFRITGDSTQKRGVVPDIMLPDPASYIESGERRLDNAVPWSKVPAAPFKRWTGSKFNVAALDAASKARQSKEAVFAKLAARNKLLSERRKQTKIQLERAAWAALRAKHRKELDAVTPDVNKGPPRFKVEPVIYAKRDKVEARPGRKKVGPTADDRWKKNLARDPWLAETIQVLCDMHAGR